MRIAMMSQDVSKPKICELLRKLRSLLDFAINSAIAELQNPGGTDTNEKCKITVNQMRNVKSAHELSS